MGEAKRRGTFEQRKAQRLAKQFGLTNQELEEAYWMNWRYNRQRYIRQNPQASILPYLLYQIGDINHGI